MINNIFIDWLTADKKSENTIKNYIRYADEFMAFVNKPEAEVDEADIAKYKLSINHLSPASINLRLNAAKSYFKCLKTCKVVSANPFDDVAMIKNNPKVKEYVSPADVKALLRATESYRAKAIISTLASTGLRFSEMCSITMEQYEQLDKYNRRDITITGKGNKQRKIYINDKTKQYIDRYLADEAKHGRIHTLLFESFNGNALDESNVCSSLKCIAKRAELPYWKEISPHWLRAACATIASQNGVPVAVIRDMLGHSSLSTTSKYIKTSQNDIENTMLREMF